MEGILRGTVRQAVREMALIFALITMFLWGTSPILGKIGLERLEPLVALTLRSSVITVCLLGWALVTGKLGALHQIDGRSALLLSAEGLMGSLFGHLAYFYALKLGDISKVVPVTAAYPLVAVVWGLLFLGDRFSLGRGAGVLLVVIGIWLVGRF